MTPLDRVTAGLETVDAMLSETVLEPDPGRRDWSEVRTHVQQLVSTVQSELVEPLEQACAALGDPRQASGVRAAVAHRLASAAAVLHASGDPSGGSTLLSQAVALAPAGDARDVWSAGRGDPASLVAFQRALWLRARGRRRESERLLRALGQSPDATLSRAAESVRTSGWPVANAPSLFQLNGCGVALFGRSGERDDGTHVATHFLTLLWVPVLPLAAYRVQKLAGSKWRFLTRERLARWARIWQGAAAVAVIGGAAWFGGRAYFESPARLARVATAEATRLEESGREAEALQRYHEVVDRYGSETDVGDSAMGVLRLSVRSVHEPCSPEQVPAASRVVAGFEKLPESAREGKPAEFLFDRLETWIGQIGQADPKAAHAALLLLNASERIADDRRRPAIRQKRLALEVALADRLAATRPLDALGHYVRVGGLPALESAGRLLDQLGDDDALWDEAAPAVEIWLKAVGAPEPRVAAVRARLGASLAKVAQRREWLAQASPDTLLAERRSNPRDQLLGAAVARHLRTQGDAEGCLRSVDSSRGPGWLIGEAQVLRASCLMDVDRDDEAAEILTAYLDDRLPAFHDARRVYENTSEALAQRLVDQARAGNLPKDVNEQLQAASEEKQAELFRAWLSAELDKDARLQVLRAEYARHGDVVPACLTLGTVELKRSQRTADEKQHEHLAAAERAFLAIREEAEGAPLYHLELGQVYHRLGRTKEGDQELSQLLERKDTDLTLEVAEVYRQLGIEDRARSILETLYSETSDAGLKQRVAFQRANTQRDRDDEDTWLRRADPADPVVRIHLLENEANRGLLAGRDEEADRAFREVAAKYDRDARHSAAAANNAALALLGRYAATGDPQHRRDAIARLESARRLSPDSAIVHGNLAEALEDNAVDEALGGLVDLRVLRVDSRVVPGP